MRAAPPILSIDWLCLSGPLATFEKRHHRPRRSLALEGKCVRGARSRSQSHTRDSPANRRPRSACRLGSQVFAAESVGADSLPADPVAQTAIKLAPVVFIGAVVTGAKPPPALYPAAVCASSAICALAENGNSNPTSGSSNPRSSIRFMCSPRLRHGLCSVARTLAERICISRPPASPTRGR